jgi:pyruvate/2-oxoglutarate dehydrogenase complex dihydrolipoamide acyltransferase (E2) component
MSGDETLELDAADCWPADADEDEAVLANWFVREGGRVDAGDAICEIQIEKVGIDVPAPEPCALVERLVADGETFERGDPLAVLRPE